jgi:hypothetical protein
MADSFVHPYCVRMPGCSHLVKDVDIRSMKGKLFQGEMPRSADDD